MEHTSFIEQLDRKSNRARRRLIEEWLESRGVPYRFHDYATGSNLIVDLGAGMHRFGVASHYDRVLESAGANDNGSAIAVCLAMVDRYLAAGSVDLSLRIFFFDEEETGLKGSRAYVREHGFADLRGLVNMEMVGMGDQFALWPLDSAAGGGLLKAFEAKAAEKGIATHRFDQIVTNTADHLPFRDAGFAEVFTVTCISDQDIVQAGDYYAALARGAGHDVLFGILSKAPLFQHYHRPTDTYDRLSDAAIERTAETIWETLEGMAV